MSKIFRLYKEGATTYEDWNSSPAFPYNSASRDTIEDPDGASANHEITSIPSPFARIDLIKTAFKEVCKQDKKSKNYNLEGNSIFHKMVSDTLDVAEIFFNLDKFEGKIEVIKWDPTLMLEELKNSGIDGHHYLEDALRKYMSSDSKTYNFDQKGSFYLLNYLSGPNELNIIGATSPATLFFSNANDLQYVDDIFFGEDKPFDVGYQPLYKRDFEFVKYMFALRHSIENFSGLFPEVEDYLAKTFAIIKDQDQKDELRNISDITLDSYEQITVVDAQHNDFVEVLGYPLYKKVRKSVTTSSDFTIKSAKATKIQPLVLPIESGNRYSDLQYTTGKWGKSNAAPYEAETSDITKRVLPFDGSQNPYLTISDFLESIIVRVPYSLNTEDYFDGNINLDEEKFSYLLPIKPLLFEYFSPEDLRGNMEDGKPMFEMTTLAGTAAVKVTLRIPIVGSGINHYIEYTRKYLNTESTVRDNDNEGKIVKSNFTGFIMPQVRFNDPTDAIYNISCVHPTSRKSEFVFYSGNTKLIPKTHISRNKYQQTITTADNYLLEKTNFDFIQIKNDYGYCGILIPIFRQQRDIETFEFAIDLGTSNTHIEYRKGTEKPEVFSFSYNDRQLCEMYIPSKNEYGHPEELIEESEIIEKDFIPSLIGGTSDFYFPTRTVLSCAKIIDWNNVVDPFTLVNLPFTYDKRSELPYNNYKYNIKWGNGDGMQVMEAYVNCLMLILRNKVLLNDGILQNTKITWFYPISMPPKRLQKLKSTWDEAYERYFGHGNTNYMTESAAPIQYFFQRYSTATDLVNIDIGGGTTDIAFAKDKDINYVTSFRFATNSLFENSFSELDENNGIVDWYKKGILKLLEENNLGELIRVYNSSNNSKPANMASFLFGLKDNKIPQKEKVNMKSIDFNYILQEDEDFKIVFIIFYTAIIYHTAQITKKLGLNVPRHISFSGNGSKAIRIITTDSKILANYTKLIYEKVLGKPYGKELELLGLEKDSNPKEVTCKGGIVGRENEDYEDYEDKIIVLKSNNLDIVKSSDTYATITEDYKNDVIDAVESFFDFVLYEMDREFKFDRYFSVSKMSMDVAKRVVKNDLLTFLEKGISQRREDSEMNDTIEETFFFYPIKGVLSVISTEIYKLLEN